MLEWPRGQGRERNTFFKQLNIIMAGFIPLLFSFTLEIYIYPPPMSADSFGNHLLLFESRAAFLKNAFRSVTLVPPPKIKRSSYVWPFIWKTEPERQKREAPCCWCMFVQGEVGFLWSTHQPKKNTMPESFSEKQNKTTWNNSAVSYLWFTLLVAVSDQLYYSICQMITSSAISICC